MDSRQIEALLERYWACKTSLEEERTIKAFFEEGNVPEGLSAYASYFSALKNKAEIQASPDTGVYPFKSKRVDRLPRSRSAFTGYFLAGMKAAAVAVILIAVGLGINTRYQNEEILQQIYSESITDPEEAFIEVSQAFNKISLSLAKAQTALTELKDSIQINPQ